MGLRVKVSFHRKKVLSKDVNVKIQVQLYLNFGVDLFRLFPFSCGMTQTPFLATNPGIFPTLTLQKIFVTFHGKKALTSIFRYKMHLISDVNVFR